MKEYRTEQKKLLLTYLSCHRDRAFSSDELLSPMAECGVGRSTVYRLLARLLEEGQIEKEVREGKRGYLYRYLEGSECRTHLHLRCLGCEKVFHLSGDSSSLFAATLQTQNGFSLDESRTLLYGLCADCAKQKKESL